MPARVHCWPGFRSAGPVIIMLEVVAGWGTLIGVELLARLGRSDLGLSLGESVCRLRLGWRDDVGAVSFLYGREVLERSAGVIVAELSSGLLGLHQLFAGEVVGCWNLVMWVRIGGRQGRQSDSEYSGFDMVK